MTAKAAEIADGNMNVRIPQSKPVTEAGQLASALNAMMERIEDAMTDQERSEERLRRFMADASHELRTPITTVQGYAELYRHGGLSNPGDLNDAMLRTRREATRMGRLVEDMMTLAKLDQGPDLETAEVDVSEVVNDAVRDAVVVAPDRTITAQAEPGVDRHGRRPSAPPGHGQRCHQRLIHTPTASALAVTAHERPSPSSCPGRPTSTTMPPRTINPETSNPGPNLRDHTASVDQFACSFSGR